MGYHRMCTVRKTPDLFRGKGHASAGHTGASEGVQQPPRVGENLLFGPRDLFHRSSDPHRLSEADDLQNKSREATRTILFPSQGCWLAAVLVFTTLIVSHWCFVPKIRAPLPQNLHPKPQSPVPDSCQSPSRSGVGSHASLRQLVSPSPNPQTPDPRH